MTDYLVQKRDRFRRLMEGRITVEEYVEMVKEEVHERLLRDRERQTTERPSPGRGRAK